MEQGRLIRAIYAGITAGWALGPTTTLADEPLPLGLELEWDVAEGCPDRDAAAAAIEDLLGKQAAGRQLPAAVSVKIARVPERRWEARIFTRTREIVGERVLQAASCDRLVEATALIVAIALDPISTAERVAVRKSAPPAAAPVNAVRPAPPQPLAAAADAAGAEHLRIAAGVRAAGDLGSLPEPTMGMGIVFGLYYARWVVETEATAWLPQVALRGSVAGSGGEIGLYTGGLRGCFDALQAFSRQLRAGPCLGAELGISTGAGVNLIHSARSIGLWGAALAGLFARQATPAVTLWMLVEVGLPFRRPVYLIEDFDRPVFQASPAAGRLSLGAAWLFL